MTTPLDSQAYPSHPTMPEQAPRGYTTPTQPDTARREPPYDAAQIEGMRGRWIELLLRQIVTAIFGFFSPENGSAFTQLVTAFTSSIPVIGQPISSAINFILNFLDPAKLLFSQTRVENPPQGAWPKTFDYEWGELTANPIELLVQNLSRILTGVLNGGNLVSAAFSIPGAALNLIQQILLPQGQIAGLEDGKLPDSQKPPSVQTMIDNVVDVAHGALVGETVDNPVEAFFDAVLGIFGAGTSAQSVNVTQNAQIDALMSGGGGIFETFEGAAAANLGPNFTQSYYDSGSGHCGLDGKGNASWSQGGASVRGCQNRHNTALTTDTQKVSIYINSNINNANTADPLLKLHGRMNAAGTDHIEARIKRTTCEIGYVVGDVYTRIGSTESHSGANGVWDLKIGTTTDDREFVLYHNNVEVCRRTDTLDASAMDASHRYAGFTMQAGVHFIWVFFQAACPDVGVFTAADRTPET